MGFESGSRMPTLLMARFRSSTVGKVPDPALGWSYAGTIIAEMATLADAFARTGDTSLI